MKRDPTNVYLTYLVGGMVIIIMELAVILFLVMALLIKG